MARSIPVEISTRTFAKQGEAVQFFKDMLNRYKVGERVTDIDHLDLAALIERHPEYRQKVGVGIDHFVIMRAEQGTNCFRIERIDGTGTDFSYMSAVRGRAPSRKQEVSHAFRWAVRYDLFNARDDFFKANKKEDGTVECAVTGELIHRDEAHMDHRPPMTFEVIVTTFLAGRGISLDDVPISTGRDNQVAPEITDENLREEFRSFHVAVAHLDVVKSGVNLSQAAKNRLKPGRVRLSLQKPRPASEPDE